MTRSVTIPTVVTGMNVLLVASAGLAVTFPSLVGTEAPEGGRPPSAPYAERLTIGMDCWGGDGAQHPFPDRVIVRGVGGDWRVGGRRAVNQALEQLFNGIDHHLEIYKFCKTSTASGVRTEDHRHG